MGEVNELKKLIRGFVEEFSCADWAADWKARQRILRKAKEVLGDEFPDGVLVLDEEEMA